MSGCALAAPGGTRGQRLMGALAITLALSVQCGGERQEREAAPHTAPRPTEGPAFDVHEWGLVSQSLAPAQGEGARTDALRAPPVGGVAPPRPPDSNRHPAPAKPVLYFHIAGEATEVLTLDVTANVAGGRIVEHFPPGEQPRRGALAWRGVTVTPGACRGVYPGAGSAECRQGDGYCERAELALFETTDADCVRHGEFQGGLLFYRGADSPMTVPLTLSFEAVGDATAAFRVTHRGPHAVTGPWVLVRRGATRRATRVRVLESTEEHPLTHIERAVEQPVDEAFLARFAAPMAEMGLTSEEIAAFRRAWDDALFGGVTVSEGAGRYALLYWLPRGTIDDAMPLSITPAPRQVRRAMLMYLDLGLGE